VQLLTFDVGGSHVAGAICDLEELRLSTRGSFPVDCNGPEEEFYGAVQKLTAQILKDASVPPSELAGMSFAFPGPFDYGEGVSHMTHKFASLEGKSLRAIFASRFGLEPARIRFVNDADAFLLGELSQVPSAQLGKSVGITLGTGVGSAFAIGGEIVRIAEGVPREGEIWNLRWKNGIVEDAISTRAIQGAYERRTGERRSVREIAERCASDDDARKVFEEFGATLGEVMSKAMAGFHPATVIFGGAISRSASWFLPYAKSSFDDSIDLRISTLFEDAALLGAAVRWKQHE
jgi:glucokinase